MSARRLEPLLVAAGVVGLFGLWETMVVLGAINPRIAPAPSTIAPMMVELLGRSTVLKSLGVTAQEVVAAFLLSVPLGFFIGFSLAEMPGLGAVLRPVVNFLFGVPKSIFLPVFILIFGVGFEQKIAFGVFTTMFVLILGGIAAVESVPRELITVARAYGANRWQVVREIYLPAMAPILMESARLGMIFNITAVLLAEIYGARDGIGYRIAAWGESLQMPQLYAALVVVAALAIAVNELLRAGRGAAWRLEAEPDMTQSAVSVRGVTQRFEAEDHVTVALEGIDLEVPPGQFVALVGPSGCGKSTLLSLITGCVGQAPAGCCATASRSSGRCRRRSA